MTKKSITLLIGILVVVLAFSVAIFAYTNTNVSEEEIAYFKNELAEFIVPPIRYKNTMYEVTQGEVKQNGNSIPKKTELEVLKIAYFSVAHRLDPIFAFPAVDLLALDEAVRSLEQSRSEIAGLFEGESSKQIAETLHPISFLKNVAALERLRRTVITAPNEEMASDYQKLLEATLLLYTAEAEALEQTFNQWVDDDSVFDYTFIGGTAGVNSFVSFLEGIALSAEEKEEKAIKRRGCMEGNISECVLLQTLFKSLVQERTRMFTEKTDFASTSVLTHREILSSYRMPNEEERADLDAMPTIALSQVECFPRERTTYFLPAWRTLNSGEQTFKPLYLNDIYFYDLVKGEQSSKLFTLLKSEELEYYYQDVSNIYMCPESGMYVSSVAAILDIRNELIEKPLFALHELTQFDENGTQKTLEEEITKSDIVYQDDVERYLSENLKLLEKHGEIVLENSALYIEELLLRYQNGTAYFDRTLLEAVDMNDFVKTIVFSGETFKINFLFLTRSYPVITFAAFNKSVYDRNIEILSHDQDGPGLLVSYKNILQDQMNVEETLLNMKKGDEIISRHLE